jgi:galactitol-specific phosphotransferase system IIB component
MRTPRVLCMSVVFAFSVVPIVTTAQEPQAILVKSDSPLVAQKVGQALKNAGVDPRAYRIKVPTAAGALPAAQVTELERRVTATNRVFGKAASDIIVLVKVITKGSQMEELLRNALKDVDKGLYQMEVLKKSGEVEAVLVKSDSPVIAEKATAALKGAGVDPRAYRIKVPTAAGTLPAAQVTELERRVTATNRDFGKAASDIIVLVKVITKGSQMEELVRNALKDVDKSLYQIQRVEQ